MSELAEIRGFISPLPDDASLEDTLRQFEKGGCLNDAQLDRLLNFYHELVSMLEILPAFKLALFEARRNLTTLAGFKAGREALR